MILDSDNLLTREEFVSDKQRSVAVRARRAVFEVIAIVLIAALFLFENGELIVKEQSFVEFIGNIAVMFVVSMLFDESYRIKGKMTAFETESYTREAEKLSKTLSEIDDKKLEKIKNGLEGYLYSRYASRVKSLIFSAGLTYERYMAEFAKLSVREVKKLNVDRGIKQAVIAAKRVKPLGLTLSQLLSEDGGATREALPKSERALDARHGAKTAVSYLLTAVLFAYYAVALVSDFNAASVGWYLVKVCFLVFRGLSSYFSAYMEITRTVLSRLRAQNFYLDLFSKTDEEQEESSNCMTEKAQKLS